ADSQENHFDRIEKDGDIEPEREALDVIEVVLQLLDRVVDGSGVVAPHLGVPGHTGAYVEPLAEIGDLPLELIDEHRPLRARPNEAHVASEHVPELRQLVETRLSQDS